MAKMNRVVFITGASRGIGKAIAKRFIDQQYRVAAGYQNNKALADELCIHEHVLPIQINIENRDWIQQALSAVQAAFGTVDILVNNAAIAQEKPFSTITDSDWDRMLAVNLRGPFSLSQEVLPTMISKKWGRIINIVSIGGQWGGYNQVHYAAAKAGLINLTQSLAKIYSAEGITTNAVSPGLVQTDMSTAELESDSGTQKVHNIPVGRVASANEVADVVTFLASDEASYITGQTINVNGGMYFG